MDISYFRGDLPAGHNLGNVVAVDTETLGLNVARDRLCAVQLSDGQGRAFVVHLQPGEYDAPILKDVLGDPARLKLFHFARFDLAVLKRYLGVRAAPVYCTKIASKLARTYTDRHGLKDLVRELLGTEISKEQQSSYWGAATLTSDQVRYAGNDVLHLHRLKDQLDAMLEREGRSDLAKACMAFLPARAELDLAGWPDVDIFAH